MNATLEITEGKIVSKGSRTDDMALYRFDGWNDAPASIHKGRLADVTWLHNGHPSSAWEADLTAILRVDRVRSGWLVEGTTGAFPSRDAVTSWATFNRPGQLILFG